MWDDLRNRIESLPAFTALRGALRGKGAAVQVAGLAGSSRGLVLAALIENGGQNVLVVTPDPVTARDFAADLVTFGVRGVSFYPEDEILPYDYHDPDRNLTGMQMKALDELSSGRSRVLVCTMRSLLRKVFDPAELKELITDLVKGEEYDTVALASRFVRLGYERHGIVEGKGQFAVRGGIVDIFEVSSEDPARIEFDGDEIGSIRNFDVETQRSTGEIGSLRVRPFTHLAPDGIGIERLRSYLERETEGLEEDERARALLAAERLENGILFYGMEHYAAVAHELVTIFDYFDKPPLAVITDQDEFDGNLADFREEIEERFEREREEGHFYPGPGSVYIDEGELGAWFSATNRIDFRKIASRDAVRFSSSPPEDYHRDIQRLEKDIRRDTGRGIAVYLFCSSKAQRDRAEDVLSEVALDIDFPEGEISSGFRWPKTGVFFLSEEEVFGRYHKPWKPSGSRSRSLSYDPSHFQPGDFVVHVDHGVGRYMGMRVLEVEGGKTECLDIRYEGDDRLFIPVSRLRMLEKYNAADGGEPSLGRLGSRAWNRARERARKSAKKIAHDLIEVYAARQLARGYAFGPDSPWQKEMEASFPWEETPHQLQATREVKADLEAQRPMDRLLCGDVGFGKTEVALRASFKAVTSGKQVAFLVPTTVLALQHYNTLRDRFQGFPVKVAMMSRFVPSAKQREYVKEIAGGKVDIVVGTHRLLGRDIAFHDLGLVVVDEEHRFGVKQKERFKKMKKSVDVLSMTATPIPRTLSMALSGIRDISVIDTPPRNRLPIHTEILPFDDERIKEAVMREIGRGGQVFFVHNRVQSIEVMEGYLARLLPEKVRIAHAHGQMNEKKLERIMIDFLDRKFDLLLCTMIIEAGLDFPNVNTIIINRADRFGLAQLYQLRGRVGRSDRKAYAFMLVPKGRALTTPALKRLQAISEFDYLGAGYRIAMRDLEIRGAGNLLGHQQSGHINDVGLDLYTRMVREEVSRMKGEAAEGEVEIRLSIPVAAYLPEDYVEDSEERMDIYRRLTRMRDAGEVAAMREELVDRFGPPPIPAGNILKAAEFRARAAAAKLESVEVGKGGTLKAEFRKTKAIEKKLIAGIAGAFEGRLTFRDEGKFSLTVEREGVKGETGGGGAPSWECVPGLADLERLLKLLEFYDK